MKYSVLAPLVIILITTLGSISTVSAKEIYDCTILNKSGKYIIKNDIINLNNNTVCIDIKVSNIFLDCNLHSIKGNFVEDSYGILTNSSQRLKNIKIENCILQEWGKQGVTITNTTGATLKNLEASNNLRKGMLIFNSKEIIVENSTLSYNEQEGISIEDSSKIIIKNNYVLNNLGLTGIMLKNNVNGGSIENNNLVNNVHGGIRLENNIQDIKIKNNQIKSNGVGSGIWLEDNIKRNLIENNEILNNSFGLVITEDSSKNIVKSNYIGNNYIGIIIADAANNFIYDNFFNNTNNVEIYNPTNNNGANFWSILKRAGKNVIGGQYLGGNFWATQSGNGYSETCLNSNNDDFCDKPYIIEENNIDSLPLTF